MPALVLAALLALAPSSAPSEKTDVVLLDNGDRIVGEIKSMTRGNLLYETDSAGTITIEWDEIRKLTSEQRFRLELLDGTRLVGSFLDPPKERTVLLRRDDGTQIILPLTDIARLTQFDRSAWERVDFYVNTGFSFTKATVKLNLNKELIEDLFWNISFYLDYDSEPTSDDGETTDYGILTGLTYTF